MTHVRVGSCRDDFLLAADFDDCRSESIFPEHEKHGEEAERDQDISYDADVGRNRGPSETMVKRGNHEHGDKCYRREELYDLLTFLRLVARACIHPPLEELRIVFREIESDRERRPKKYYEKDPRLPVVDGPSHN